MSVEYVDEYSASGVDYRETFTDLETAKRAMLVAWNAAYPATIDSPLFMLSCSELLGNEGERITKFDPTVSLSETTRIRVTDALGVTDTVLFSYLPQYLQRRAALLMGQDSMLWTVKRKGIDTDTGDISWMSVYTASTADL